MSHRDLTYNRRGHHAEGRRRRRHLQCGCLRVSVRRLGHRPECTYYRPEQANNRRWKNAMTRKIQEQEGRS